MRRRQPWTDLQKGTPEKRTFQVQGPQMGKAQTHPRNQQEAHAAGVQWRGKGWVSSEAGFAELGKMSRDCRIILNAVGGHRTSTWQDRSTSEQPLWRLDVDKDMEEEERNESTSERTEWQSGWRRAVARTTVGTKEAVRCGWVPDPVPVWGAVLL